MNSEELEHIRLKVNDLYNVIKGATADLDTLRTRCPHTQWRIGEYGWAIGHTFTARICTYCDECLGQVTETSTGEYKCE